MFIYCYLETGLQWFVTTLLLPLHFLLSPNEYFLTFHVSWLYCVHHLVFLSGRKLAFLGQFLKQILDLPIPGGQAV